MIDAATDHDGGDVDIEFVVEEESAAPGEDNDGNETERPTTTMRCEPEDQRAAWI